MKGPYGLNALHFMAKPGTPASNVYCAAGLRGVEEGLVSCMLYIQDYGTPLLLASALCVFVEGDEETFQNAKQWLLDMTMLRTVPADSGVKG